MDPTTAVAIYGASLSTAIAGAQLVKWALQRRTKLRVEVEEGFDFSEDGHEGEKRWAVLWIHVVNDGERDEQITRVYLDRLGPNGEWLPDNGVLPDDDIIAPRQRKSYGATEQAAAEEASDIDLSGLDGPYRVSVETARGQEFASPTQPPLTRGNPPS